MSSSVRRLLETRFPNLKATDYEVTSLPDRNYNCFAWAANDVVRWWEPIQSPGCYWPDNVPLSYSVETYVSAYQGLGFSLCESPDIEPGSEKLALYVKDNLPCHAARQLPDGQWTSKLGTGHDIRHSALASLEGDEYGTVDIILKRPHSL